jgi:hypothetical protein
MVFIAALPAACSEKKISHLGEPPSPVPIVNGKPWLLPPGIVAPPDKRGAIEIDGLYSSNVPGDHMCCWVGQRSLLHAVAPPGATALELTVFVPKPVRPDRPQSIDVSIDGAPPVHRIVQPGVTTQSFPLSVQPQGRPVNIGLVTGYTFVPKEAGINADTRHLGIVVLRVDFQTG